MAISSPLKSKIPKSSTTTVKKFQTILFNRTRVKKEIFQNKTILQNRRVENERRVQAEEELEAPDIATKKNGPAQLIAGSAKGFFERILGFLGYVTAGWIINNLPTWISMGKEFIARTQQMGKILGNFIKNTTDIFQNFTGLLSASLTNIMTFDFLDTSGRVGAAFEELQLSVDNWGTGFEDAIKLITTPLTEGIASGEDARPTGTQNTDEGAYERGAPYSGGGGSDTTYSSTGGQKLTDPGGKDYGFYSPGADGSRGSARAHGTGGQKGHTGEDYAMPTGTALTMIAPGTVVAAVKGDRYNGGYGEFVVVQLDDGRYVKLAHLDSINVKKGDKVGAGTGPNGTAKVIGRSGSTGLGSGPHLHLDVAKSYDSNSYMVSGTTDPKSFIDGGGLVKGGKVTATGVVTQTKPPASQPQQQLVGNSSSSSSGGGKYKPLLDLISSGESSGGGYSAMYPSENYPQILNMSIAEVIQFQKQKGKDGRISAAIGRYQMLYPENYASAGGIPLTAKFSPENQDKMAIAYLKKNRRLSEWEQGKISDEALSEELAREFGAFKSATGFVLPGNTGSINFNKLKPVLKQIKSGSPQTQAQTSSPTTTKSTTQSSPTQTQAQITPTGTQQNTQANQSLTPERRGQTVIISQNPSQPQQQTMPYGGGGSSGGGSSSQTNEFSLLNIFMKNKLLLDLAYL